MTLPGPLWVVSLASLAQSAVLIALAAWTGGALAPEVGLRAQAAFGPHGGAIMGDIPNYTNIQPTIQVSEVKL